MKKKTEEVKARHDYIRERLQETRGDWECAGYEVMMKFHLSHVTATKHVRMIAKEMGMDVKGAYKLPKGVDKLEVKAKKTLKSNGEPVAKDGYFKARKIDKTETKFKCRIKSGKDTMWIGVRAKDEDDARARALEQVKGAVGARVLEVMTHKDHNDKYRRSSVYTSRNFL